MKKSLLAVLLASTMLLMSACGKAASTPAATSTPASATGSSTSTEAPSYKPGQFKIRVATVVSGEHAWVKMAEYMKDELAKRSNGAIEVSIFPGGQLGNDEACIDDMRVGTLDMLIGGTQNAAPFVSQYQILGLAYLFADRDQFEGVLVKDGAVFNYIQDKYSKNGLGLKLLSLCNGGQRDLHTGKEIKSVADLKNLKMRVTSSATESLVWSKLGTIPTSMSFNDIYSGMQTNTVNAFECTAASYHANALYEVAPYFVQTAHQFTPTHITCSELAYNKLPADIQAMVSDVADEAGKLGSKLADEADDSLTSKLVAEKGVTLCAVDKSEFKAIVEPLYPEIAKSCDGQELLDIINTEIKK
ncbi:MAG: TRAP transporter substrate-binding protein [Candidatus Fimivivens sp.]|nr:TRAP transporter substrate-binding protein [Candidatus Fimivivens sp.]